MDLYLGLGSNLGDRKANLLRAIGLLDKRLPGRRNLWKILRRALRDRIF